MITHLNSRLRAGFLTTTLGLAALSAPVFGTVLFSDAFDYSDGVLLKDQDGWEATDSGTNLLTIKNGAVSFSQGGGVTASFGSLSSGTFYVGFDISVSSATSASTYGDYFISLRDDGGATLTVRIKPDGDKGFLLGTRGAGTGYTTVDWGSESYSFTTTYRLVFEYTFSVNDSDDMATLYVDNSAISTHAISHKSVSLVGLYSNTTGVTSLTLDNLVVATTFAETLAMPSSVPEPTAYAAIIGGLALAGMLVARRRRAVRK
jgi:hypothetical protein